MRELKHAVESGDPLAVEVYLEHVTNADFVQDVRVYAASFAGVGVVKQAIASLEAILALGESDE